MDAVLQVWPDECWRGCGVCWGVESQNLQESREITNSAGTEEPLPCTVARYHQLTTACLSERQHLPSPDSAKFLPASFPCT